MTAVRAFRAPFLAATLVCLAVRAAGQDAPTPPLPPAGEAPKPALRQDAEGVAALKRLADLVPSPFHGGRREITCTATLQSDLPFAVRGRLRWASGTAPDARFDLPAPLYPPDVAKKLRGQYESLLTLPFLVRAAWDPEIWRQGEVVAARRGDEDLVVSYGPPAAKWRTVFTIGADRLPSSYRLVKDDAPQGGTALDLRTTFTAHGALQALSRLDAALPNGGTRTVEITHYAHLVRVSVPLRIERRDGDGKSETLLLHDYRVDGQTLEGTSRAEAVAGRMRRKDEGARNALAKWDAAVPGCDAAAQAGVTCRLEYTTPTGVRRFRVAWRHGVLDSCEPEPRPDGSPETDAAAWGAAFVVGEGVADHLLQPSRQLTAFDATLGSGKDAVLVLDALLPDAPVRRLRIRTDAAGLPVDAVQEYGDGQAPGTFRWEWTPFREKRVLACDTVERGEFRMVTRTAWYDVPGAPPLRRSIERTVSGGSGAGLYRSRFTDWTLGGGLVAGTESSPAPKPPGTDAPK